jgi:hypothetical protein
MANISLVNESFLSFFFLLLAFLTQETWVVSFGLSALFYIFWAFVDYHFLGETYICLTFVARHVYLVLIF